MPLIFPKILDGSQFISDHSVYIDIGYMHTTFVFEEYNQIDSFDTFVYGSKMLMDMLVSGFPKLSYTEIENLMLRSKLSLGEKEIRDSLFREYFSYVIDTFLSLLLGEKSKIIL